MPSSSACRIEKVLDVVSDLWTLAIIHELSVGPRRTLELLGAFTGMSRKTLADRLKKLDRVGVVSRKSYPESPPRVEYSLTPKGRELLPVLRAIAEVALVWEDGAAETTRARSCLACEMTFKKLPDIEAPAPPPDRPRKRTDVTLL
jgi:DNA-binding HxlR family transcriptional regulator